MGNVLVYEPVAAVYLFKMDVLMSVADTISTADSIEAEVIHWFFRPTMEV